MRPALPISKLKDHHNFLSRHLYSALWVQTDLSRSPTPQLPPLCSQLLPKGFLLPSPTKLLHRRDMRRENGASQTLLRPGDFDRQLSWRDSAENIITFSKKRSATLAQPVNVRLSHRRFFRSVFCQCPSMICRPFTLLHPSPQLQHLPVASVATVVQPYNRKWRTHGRR